MKKTNWLVGIAFLVLIAGCRSSYITSSWKAENTVIKKYNKVLVLGLIRDNDRRLQQQMEEHMAGDLRDMGYNAVTSLSEYGPKAFSQLTEKEALSKLKNSEVDAVVTIVLLNKKLEKEFVPNRGMHMTTAYYQNRFWDYYGAINSRIYQPGYYVTDTHYFWESNFYDLDGRSLIYSVQTQSFDPANAESLGHEYGQMIVKDMAKKGIVKTQSNTMMKVF